MRYYEIITAGRGDDLFEGNVAAAARKTIQRRLKANQRLNNARRKKVEAGRKYQDDLRSAREAEQAAISTLSSLR